MPAIILIRGGGDLASGVAVRLHRAGMHVIITELPQPLAVRRAVSFSETVYEGAWKVEEVASRLASPDQLQVVLEAGEIPVLVDPNANVLGNAILTNPQTTIVVDARLTKQSPEPLPIQPLLHIGLGPAFTAPADCHAVIETQRGHSLGRVIWEGSASADSGQPEGDSRRVLRALKGGIIHGFAKIGDHLEAGQIVAEIESEIGNQKSQIASPFQGVLRGIIHDGLVVTEGLKIGDVDPRDQREYCFTVSDKALAVGGSVLEILLALPEIRNKLWDYL